MAVEYGIFLKSSDRTRVAVYDSIAEVGEFFSRISEESRTHYEVRERTITVGPWLDYPAAGNDRPVSDPGERNEALFGRDTDA